VNRIKNLTYRCHHEKMYCKFSVILCLNVLIRLYLIKYVLICIYFEVNLTIGKKNKVQKLCLHCVDMKRHFQRGL